MLFIFHQTFELQQQTSLSITLSSVILLYSVFNDHLRKSAVIGRVMHRLGGLLIDDLDHQCLGGGGVSLTCSFCSRTTSAILSFSCLACLAFQNCFWAEYRLMGHTLNRQSERGQNRTDGHCSAQRHRAKHSFCHFSETPWTTLFSIILEGK